jgi:hypothetical protein
MREPLPLASVVHATASRTRLRVVSRRGDAEYFRRCAAALAELPGVDTVEARAMTASVLVHHDNVPLPSLATAAERAGLFILAALDDAADPPDMPSAPAMGALAFGALGVMQLFNNRVLPPALTLFWYAATLAKSIDAKRGR